MVKLMLLVAMLAPASARAAPAKRAAQPHARAHTEIRAPVLTTLVATLGIPVALTDKERKKLGAVAKAVIDRRDATARRRWTAFIRRYVKAHSKTTEREVNALLGLVAKEAYLDQHDDLALAAAKVAFFNRQEQAVRAHVTALRQAVAGLDDDAKLTLQPIEVPAFAVGRAPTSRGRAKTMTAAEWRATSTRLGKALEDVEERGRLGNHELQRLMANYNRATQLAESLFKKLDESDNAVINKV